MASPTPRSPRPTQIYASAEVLGSTLAVTYASYQRVCGGGLAISFTQAGRVGSLCHTTWKRMLALFPAIASLLPDQDTGILVYDPLDALWKSTTLRPD